MSLTLRADWTLGALRALGLEGRGWPVKPSQQAGLQSRLGKRVEERLQATLFAQHTAEAIPGLTPEDQQRFATHAATLLRVERTHPQIVVRIGLPSPHGLLVKAAVDLATDEHPYTPVLISANSLWIHEEKRFTLPGELPRTVINIKRDRKAGTPAYVRKGKLGSPLDELDVALDSAGFVAMNLPKYNKKYPWTIEQYVELAYRYGWTWWSAMDFCCEPEIASDRTEVERRVYETGANLLRTFGLVDWYRSQLPSTGNAEQDQETAKSIYPDPLPILQGWTVDDYEQSAIYTNEALVHAGREWPTMVGVGSVCRRQEGGDSGIDNVLKRLDKILPSHVTLHLFGVKGTMLGKLADNPRVASTDSQAWGLRLRKAAHHEGFSATTELRAEEMVRWYHKQQAILSGAEGPRGAVERMAAASPGIAGGSVRELRDLLVSEYGLAKETWLTDGHDHVHVSMITVPKSLRGEGRGTRAMEHLVRWADQQGRILTLTPDGSMGTGKARLEKWYRSLGFKTNLGRKRNFKYSGAMIRYPVEPRGGSVERLPVGGREYRSADYLHGTVDYHGALSRALKLLQKRGITLGEDPLGCGSFGCAFPLPQVPGYVLKITTDPADAAAWESARKQDNPALARTLSVFSFPAYTDKKHGDTRITTLYGIVQEQLVGLSQEEQNLISENQSDIVQAVEEEPRRLVALRLGFQGGPPITLVGLLDGLRRAHAKGWVNGHWVEWGEGPLKYTEETLERLERFVLRLRGLQTLGVSPQDIRGPNVMCRDDGEWRMVDLGYGQMPVVEVPEWNDLHRFLGQLQERAKR